MYSPEAFKVEDRATLQAFMRQHHFATLVTHREGSTQATHVPLVLKEEGGPHGLLRGRIRSGVISRPAKRCS
jgi:transcriptional regulator